VRDLAWLLVVLLFFLGPVQLFVTLAAGQGHTGVLDAHTSPWRTLAFTRWTDFGLAAILWLLR
jgi:hypothetical protein